MKAILEFMLPDDEVAFKNASEAGKAFSLINRLNSNIRQKLKYDSPGGNEEEFLHELQGDIYDVFPDIDTR